MFRATTYQRSASTEQSTPQQLEVSSPMPRLVTWCATEQAMHTIAELQQAQQALLAAKSPPSESQQQTLPSSIAGNRQPAWAQNAPGVNWRRRSHRQRQQTVLQQPEPQLASFMKLRQAVNARDLYRRTPLIVAAKQGHLECTQTLVEAASNLFAVDREGNT